MATLIGNLCNYCSPFGKSSDLLLRSSRDCAWIQHYNCWPLNKKQRTSKGPEQIRNLQYVGHGPEKRQKTSSNYIIIEKSSDGKRHEVRKYIPPGPYSNKQWLKKLMFLAYLELHEFFLESGWTQDSTQVLLQKAKQVGHPRRQWIWTAAGIDRTFSLWWCNIAMEKGSFMSFIDDSPLKVDVFS